MNDHTEFVLDILRYVKPVKLGICQLHQSCGQTSGGHTCDPHAHVTKHYE